MDRSTTSLRLSIASLALAACLTTALAADDAAKDDFQPGNATVADSVANERTPRMEKPGEKGLTPGPGEGAMDDDASLSADDPIKGRAPDATAPSEAPGRE